MTDLLSLNANLEELLDQVRGRVDHRALERLADEGLTFSQARVIHMLNARPEPVPIHVVAEDLDMSVASAGRNIDSLVRRGFVRRDEDPHDRRVRLVSATDEGRARLSDQKSIWHRALREWVDDLPVDIAGALNVALARALAGHSAARPTRKETV